LIASLGEKTSSSQEDLQPAPIADSSTGSASSNLEILGSNPLPIAISS
jgi:hypothetical protein